METLPVVRKAPAEQPLVVQEAMYLSVFCLSAVTLVVSWFVDLFMFCSYERSDHERWGRDLGVACQVTGVTLGNWLSLLLVAVAAFLAYHVVSRKLHYWHRELLEGVVIGKYSVVSSYRDFHYLKVQGTTRSGGKSFMNMLVTEHAWLSAKKGHRVDVS